MCFAALALVASPASGSPETSIDIHEEPVGVSESHLFLLRVSDDNLGYHESKRVEVFLVAIDWETGDEQATLIDRFVKSADYGSDGDYQGYSIKRDSGVEPKSPHQILVSRGAVPWLAAHRPVSVEVPPQISADIEAIRVRFGQNQPYQISRAAIQRQLDRQRAFMASNVADHPRSSTMTTRQYFEDRQISASDCRPDRLLNFWVPDRTKLSFLMRVICAADDDGNQTSLVVQLQTASDDEADQ